MDTKETVVEQGKSEEEKRKPEGTCDG